MKPIFLISVPAVFLIVGCAEPNFEPNPKQYSQDPELALVVRFYSAYNSKNIKEMMKCLADNGCWLADDAGIPKEMLKNHYQYIFKQYPNFAIRIGIPFHQPAKTRNDGHRVRLEVSIKYLDKWSTSLWEHRLINDKIVLFYDTSPSSP